MALITIPANDIQEFFDSNKLLEITSVSWNEYNGPEVEFSVNCDMDYEDEDFVERSELTNVEAELVQLQTEYNKLEQDHISLKNMYDELLTSTKVEQCKYDNLALEYNRFKDMMKRKPFSWKFWETWK